MQLEGLKSHRLLLLAIMVLKTAFNWPCMLCVVSLLIQDDDPGYLARHFGHQHSFTTPMIHALAEFLANEIKNAEPD